MCSKDEFSVIFSLYKNAICTTLGAAIIVHGTQSRDVTYVQGMSALQLNSGTVYNPFHSLQFKDQLEQITQLLIVLPSITENLLQLNTDCNKVICIHKQYM